MLIPNTIKKVLDWYFSCHLYDEEIKKALTEFFGENFSHNESALSEDGEKKFNEWFLYDFQLANKLTALANFYHDNL